MFADHLAEVIGRAQGSALDDVTRALWAAHSAGQCTDDDATRLSDAIQARRMLGKAAQAAAGGGSLKGGCISRRKHQRPPVRSVAWERRRRLAASGPMPPALAQRFTTGELAVLRIVADEFRDRGACTLCLDAMAARAGVGRTTAQNTLRQAKRLGMVEVVERRRTGAKSLPNVIRITDREWLAWIRHTGFKKTSTTETRGFRGDGGRAVQGYWQSQRESGNAPETGRILNAGHQPRPRLY